MGSDSDLPTMKDAAEVLEAFGVKYELTIVSAHRTPERMYEYAQSAARRGVQVCIYSWDCVIVCVDGPLDIKGWRDRECGWAVGY